MSSRLDPMTRQPASQGSGLMAVLLALLSAGARVLAFGLYAVLSTFEPLVRLALLLLAFGGLVTIGIYRFLLRDPHFPLWTLLIFSISMCVLWGLYALLLQRLARA